MGMNNKQIAEIAHETNAAYCRTIGDHSQPAWKDAPDWQKQSAINGVKFHLENHAKGLTPSPSRSHDAWLEEKRRDGWKYGPVKDPAKKEHPCYLDYHQLPSEQRIKDSLFGAVVAVFVEHS